MRGLKKIIAGALAAVMLVASAVTFNSVETKAAQASILPDTAGGKVRYCTHVQDYGWLKWVSDGGMSGTEGQSKRLESIAIELDPSISGGIEYSTHIQNIGWTDYRRNGAQSGTTGSSLRLEGIKIRLTGEAAQKYDVYYKVHVQNVGWMNWVKNGDMAGTSGRSLRLEGICIKLVEKPPVSVNYRTHVQNDGWQGYVGNGEMSGTSGRSLRLEGINIKLDIASSANVTGGISYRTHIQNIGWESAWKNNGEMSGTSGRSLRLEAIQIQLTGKIAESYDVYYRVHAQNIGWMGWAKNGEIAGTSGKSYRLEGIQIIVRSKNEDAPSTSFNGIVQKNANRFIGNEGSFKGHVQGENKTSASDENSSSAGSGTAGGAGASGGSSTPSSSSKPDTNGWVSFYPNSYDVDRRLGQAYRVSSGYYISRDASGVADGSNLNNLNLSAVEYSVMDNPKAKESAGYKVGDASKFSCKVEGMTGEALTYMNGYDSGHMLASGKALPTYDKGDVVNGDKVLYKYTLTAYPNYQNSICDLQEEYERSATTIYSDGTEKPYISTYRINFPDGCVDGSYRVKVYYDGMLIDNFTVTSAYGTTLKPVYDAYDALDSGLTTPEKLMRIRDFIRSYYSYSQVTCIGGAHRLIGVARHKMGLKVGLTANTVGMEHDAWSKDENVNERCVISTGEFLNKVYYYDSTGLINPKKLKNVNYGSYTMSSYPYTHVAALVYYDGKWTYWNAQGH